MAQWILVVSLVYLQCVCVLHACTDQGRGCLVEQNEPVKVAEFTDRSVELCVRVCESMCGDCMP